MDNRDTTVVGVQDKLWGQGFQILDEGGWCQLIRPCYCRGSLLRTL